MRVSTVQDVLQNLPLSSDMRSSYGNSLCRVVCRGTQNHAQNRVLVCHGVVKSLDDDSSHSFAPAVAICRVVKRLAVSGTGEEAATIETSRKVRVRQNIGA